MSKIALISGITGQDGSFLAEFLIDKGYEVHGILRRSYSFNTGRIEHLYLDEWVRDMKKNRLINLHYGCLLYTARTASGASFPMEPRGSAPFIIIGRRMSSTSSLSLIHICTPDILMKSGSTFEMLNCRAYGADTPISANITVDAAGAGVTISGSLYGNATNLGGCLLYTSRCV